MGLRETLAGSAYQNGRMHDRFPFEMNSEKALSVEKSVFPSSEVGFAHTTSGIRTIAIEKLALKPLVFIACAPRID